MTPAQIRHQRAGLQLRIARARLLLQVSGPDRDASLADVMTFSRVVGGHTEADTLDAFRSAQTLELLTAQAALDQLQRA